MKYFDIDKQTIQLGLLVFLILGIIDSLWTHALYDVVLDLLVPETGFVVSDRSWTPKAPGINYVYLIDDPFKADTVIITDGQEFFNGAVLAKRNIRTVFVFVGDTMEYEVYLYFWKKNHGKILE